MARMPKPWFDRERRVWKVTINGKRHNLGTNKKTAIVEFHRLMQLPAEHQRVSPQSLAALFDSFLAWVEKHRAPDTYEWYRYRLQRFVKRYPEMTIGELKVHHVQTWADSYDFSRTSRRNYLRSVKTSLNWATKQGYIEQNPIQHLELPAQDRREVFVSYEEYEAVQQLAGDALRELIKVTWETGCRPQESLRVEARHVDVANQRWVFPKIESKGQRTNRVVYLTDEAMHITRCLMLRNPAGKLFRNTNGNAWTSGATNCAFDQIRIRMGKSEMRRLGKEVSRRAVERFIPSLNPNRTEHGELRPKTPAELRCEAKRKLTNRLAMGLATRYSLYAIRHSWATHALERGIDSVTVAVLMGHADPSTLARVYQHLSQNPKYLLDQAKRARG
jgi:integrase